MIKAIAEGWNEHQNFFKSNIWLKIYNVLQNVREIVDKPKPDVYVTDLTGDGVNIAIYFWIDTEKKADWSFRHYRNRNKKCSEHWKKIGLCHQIW